MRKVASILARRLSRDEQGATLVEFAFIATPLLLLLMGSVELGYMGMRRSTVEGALREAARMATTGNVTEADIDDFIEKRTKMSSDTNVTIVKKSYDDFEQVNRPEPITTDTAPVGEYNKGDCFRDLNGNEKWDADSGSAGLGSAEDIIYYEVTVDYAPMFPFMKIIPGFPDKVELTANTVLRNEPFARAVDTMPKTVCTS